MAGSARPKCHPPPMPPLRSRGGIQPFRISGNATELIVATVARLDPLIAPKPAQPLIEAKANPPRRWPTNFAATSKKSRLAPAAKHRCAMSRNKR